jgi:hypothetical protein
VNLLKTSVLAVGAATLLSLPTAQAGQRHFAYTYETTTATQGTWEIENWASFERSPLHDSDLNSFQFRHEIEYGVTSRFQLAVYIANWDFAPRGGEEEEEEEADKGGGGEAAEVADAGEAKEEKAEKPHRSGRYGSSGVELIYNISNPNTDWIGSAVYLEANYGDRFAELEGKILLQKNFGPVIVAYNAICELEWEGAHLDQEEIELGQSIGVSYQVTPNVAVGGELLHQIDMPEWKSSNAERAHIFLGPNLTVHGKNFFVTASALWRTSDTTGEPDMLARVIVGVDF